MSDPINPNLQNRKTPQWGLYQREGFWGPNDGKWQLFDTDPKEIRKLAEKKLSEGGWYYSSCNAGVSWTHLANRQAFYRYQIIPRQLVDTNSRDTKTEIFGHTVSAPIGFAPVGINRIYHPTGELSVARVAKELNLVYSLSSAGSYSIEDVAKANGNGPRFFQLYESHDDEQAISMLKRAHENGYTACILTTDTWQLAWRHHDVFSGNYAFYHEHGPGDIGLQDPVFQKRLAEANIDPTKNPKVAGAKWIDENICVADAKKAVEYGVDGIIVSNHAGRQVDGAIASLDALEKIVEAVGDKTYVMFDSGIRTGADVFKALALGAKFVFIGRLWIWGLGIAGEDGVRHVMKSLLADFDILMNVAGYPDLEELSKIGRDALHILPANSTVPVSPEDLV